MHGGKKVETWWTPVKSFANKQCNIFKKEHKKNMKFNLVDSCGKMWSRICTKHVHWQEKVIPGTCDGDDDDENIQNLTSLI